MELEIFTPSKEGYAAVHSFESWTIAYLTYAERFDNITQLERHSKTDEIFVLLEGSAVLFIGEYAKQVNMEKKQNVKCEKGRLAQCKGQQRCAFDDCGKLQYKQR